MSIAHVSTLPRPVAAAAAAAAWLLTIVTAAPAAPGGETAQYEMTFTATWSASTHPVDFPTGAHFSGLIGGTHNGTVHFWREGELASNGIERMAETGSKTSLRAEVQAQIDGGNAGAVIDGGAGITSPGQTSLTFAVSTEFPRATIVTMIAPSPDWFVGTDSVLLYADGDWVDELVVELAPYDAGTDSGPGYNSPNQDTNPKEPIAEITGYPLYVEKEQRVPPLGTFVFRRLDVDPCPADMNDDGDVGFDDLTRVLAAWGNEGGEEDIDGSGVVDFRDLLALLEAWGAC